MTGRPQTMIVDELDDRVVVTSRRPGARDAIDAATVRERHDCATPAGERT